MEDDSLEIRKKAAQRKKNEALFRLTSVVIDNEMEFRTHFKMSRSSFDELIRRYHEDWTSINGRAGIKTETGFMLLFWTLVHKESFKTISERFNLAKGHAHNVFLKACRLLYEDKANYVKWPDDWELPNAVNEFKTLKDVSFPGTIGCLGATHIRISGHRIDESYSNFYGYKSVVVQAVCDANRMFTNVYVGWPGSSQNGIVWQHNPLYELLKKRSINKEYHLLADSTFPVDTFLMCPYPNDEPLNETKKHFNKRLNAVREEIDNTFLTLKSCFTRIQDLDLNKIEYAKYIIMSVFVIYNFIMSQNESLEIDEYADELTEECKVDDFCLIKGEPHGLMKRDQIASKLMKNK